MYRGVLVLLNCVPILVSLDWFSHCITMEMFTPAQWKTAKIHCWKDDNLEVTIIVIVCNSWNEILYDIFWPLSVQPEF